MGESTVSLSNDSVLIDDIETVFKYTGMLAESIRGIFNTGMGGNPIPVYIEFKKQFSFLYCMSSDHKDIRNKTVLSDISKWRDEPGISVLQMMTGLKLFEQYKTELFKGQLLKYY